MGRRSTKEFIGNILDVLEPGKKKNITEISEEVGDRKTVAKYLNLFERKGVIKSVEKGRQKFFWMPVKSDRSYGLRLRGFYYSICKAIEFLKDLKQDLKGLIEDTNYPRDGLDG